MATTNSASKRLIAMMLCTLMAISIFAFSPTIAHASDPQTWYDNGYDYYNDYTTADDYHPVTIIAQHDSTISYQVSIDSGATLLEGYIGYAQVNGYVTLFLPHDAVSEIIAASIEGHVIFNLTYLDDVDTVILPWAAMSRLANANFGIELRKSQGIIVLNRIVTASIATQSPGTDIAITLREVPRAQLNTTQQDVLNEYDIVYNIVITADTLNITNFDYALTVMVPYTGRLPVAVWRFLPDGRLEDIPSTHNPAGQYVTFSPPYLSLFIVGPELDTVQPPVAENPFTDVHTDHWFYDAVRFNFANNLMGPTSMDPVVFSPNMSLNRAMIVTILHRREGTPPPVNAENPFSDVPQGQWFTDAVIWAAENGIVTGFGDGRFNPGANISRQDLAVILMRYADFKDYSFPTVTTYAPFADNDRISGYARDAVREAVQAGIITGRSGNMFAPLDNSTRAETAMMLYRFFNSAE